MEISVLDLSGKDTGRKVEFSDSVFAITPNDHSIYLDVKLYLANQRQGTSKSKERAEISGSTRKIKKQKGTGTARAGSIKSPVFRGGGRAFGPRPRNYGFKVNKKVKELARKSALTYKMQAEAIRCVEEIKMDTPSTQSLIAIAKSLNIMDKKSIIVLNDLNKNLYLSSRNLQKLNVMLASSLSTYEILNAKELIFVEGSVAKLEEVLNK